MLEHTHTHVNNKKLVNLELEVIKSYCVKRKNET